HQRLFQRLLAQLAPRARQPIPFRLYRLGYRAVIEATIPNKAFFYTLVLAGEEIPDLFQKIAAENPATDPFIRAVNKYHRMEEARHLSFARAVLPEVWVDSSRLDRFLVRHVAPHLIGFMFDSMVHPGVYEVVGLPAWATWRRANRTEPRVAMRHASTRPIVSVLQDAGAFASRRVPRAWRKLAGVGPHAEPASLSD
ncbi:MAG TPA: diiron oxygenase, partial [Acidimicrobiales bacterium]|nr:diiron oxygenase [Acidimicrobiales bacterium]